MTKRSLRREVRLAAVLLPVVLLPAGCLMPRVVEERPVRDFDSVALALAAEVIVHANEARVSRGVRPLTSTAELNAAAADYARELAARALLTHTSERTGYGTPMERMQKAGANVVRSGENLAMLSVRPALPAAVVQLWLGSEGHRRNLLDERFTQTGAGAARGPRNGWYFVQVYATPAPRRR